MVAIIVGKDRKTYYAHRDILCAGSDYFRAALMGQFKEAQSSRIEFPEEEPATLEVLLFWLYKYPPIDKCGPMARPKNYEEAKSCISLLAFSRTILVEQYANLCTDAARSCYFDKFCIQEDRLKAADLSLLWEHQVGPKLRACLCLAEAIQMKRKTESSNFAAETFQLVEQGGEFAVMFTKFLLFSQRELRISPLDVLCEAFNCLFHEHRTTKPCDMKSALRWPQKVTGIREALEYIERASKADAKGAES
ncbi:MAG: hypothetical protein Q9218_006811 [Villophora microphyllina]